MNFDSLLYWDAQLFLKINAGAGTWLDYLFGWPTYLGEYYFFLPLTLILLFIWDPRRALPSFVKIVICVLLAGALNHILKDLIQRPRPWSYFYHDIDEGLVNPTFLFSIDTARSFPSGHTTAIFSLATALTALYGRKVLWIYLVAFWIGITRVFCGAHFPLDVLGGATVGTLTTLFSIWVLSRPALNKIFYPARAS